MHAPPRSVALPLALALAWLLVAGPAVAQDDRWPQRVGRIAELDGRSWTWDADEREWVSAWRNRPLSEGDRLAVGDGARALLQIGRSVVHLGSGSELELLVLDDARTVLQLHRGALAWRLHSAGEARQVELLTVEGSLRPLEAGQYRADRGADGPTWAGVWQGRLEFVGGGNLLHLDAGERVELRAVGGGVRTRVAAMPADTFGAWVRADADRGLAESWRHVPPQVPGADELDRYGRWDRHPDHGAVWVPYALPPGWVPFADGRWVWLRPWGWTWVDAMPWGFAPFHYGRWLRWDGQWIWWPGPRDARPVFLPALVAWVGGSGVSVGITIGAGMRPPPPPAWVLLPPHQPYVPVYRPPPRHPRPPLPWVPPEPPRDVRPPRHVHPVPPPYARRDAGTLPAAAHRQREAPAQAASPQVRRRDLGDDVRRTEPRRHVPADAGADRDRDRRGEGRGDGRVDGRVDGRGDGRGDGRREAFHPLPPRAEPPRPEPPRPEPSRAEPSRAEPRRGGPPAAESRTEPPRFASSTPAAPPAIEGGPPLRPAQPAEGRSDRRPLRADDEPAPPGSSGRPARPADARGERVQER